MAKLVEWLSDISYDTLQGNPAGSSVLEVVFDSRKAAPNTVFVCVKGANIDSHKYIPDVITKGCTSIVVEEDLTEAGIDKTAVNEDVTIIKVKNSREALAKLSAARFGHPSEELTVIAITGTKGKTTTAHMIHQILETAGIKAGCIGTTGV